MSNDFVFANDDERANFIIEACKRAHDALLDELGPNGYRVAVLPMRISIQNSKGEIKTTDGSVLGFLIWHAERGHAGRETPRDRQFFLAAAHDEYLLEQKAHRRLTVVPSLASVGLDKP